MERVATLVAREAVPRFTPPSKNVTDPVPPAGATVAVSVIAWATFDGLSELVRVVVVAIGFTTSLTRLETAPEKLSSPPYAAVRLWVPVAKVVEKLALPPEIPALPMFPCPSMKLMNPVAVTGFTLAVSVMD